MDTTSDQELKKSHARWESQHGHWLKDLEIWMTKHEDAREIIDSLERSLKTFAEQVEVHKAHIKDHHHLVQMNEEALAWRQQHPGKKGQGAARKVQKFQQRFHDLEEEVHELLRLTHSNVVDDIEKLADIFEQKV